MSVKDLQYLFQPLKLKKNRLLYVPSYICHVVSCKRIHGLVTILLALGVLPCCKQTYITVVTVRPSHFTTCLLYWEIIGVVVLQALPNYGPGQDSRAWVILTEQKTLSRQFIYFPVFFKNSVIKLIEVYKYTKNPRFTNVYYDNNFCRTSRLATRSQFFK